jgi:hypothetical protein
MIFHINAGYESCDYDNNRHRRKEGRITDKKFLAVSAA